MVIHTPYAAGLEATVFYSDDEERNEQHHNILSYCSNMQILLTDNTKREKIFP
jgi:hypothetical protein